MSFQKSINIYNWFHVEKSSGLVGISHRSILSFRHDVANMNVYIFIQLDGNSIC